MRIWIGIMKVTSAAVTSVAVSAVSSPAKRASSPLPSGENVARLLPPQHLVDEVLQLRPERVARRDHAHGPPVLHDRDVPEAAFVHEVQGVRERLVRV